MTWTRLFPHLVALICVVVSVNSYDGHYMGGAMFFEATSVDQFRITTLIAWKNGYGPCGDNCTIHDIGQVTNFTREQVTNTSGEEHYGQWIDVLSFTARNARNNATSVVSNAYHGQVSMVNQRQDWEQELGVFYVGVDSTAQHTDLTFTGDFWQDYDYAGQENVTFTMAARLVSTLRGDTGLPNNSPVVLFQPVYRVALNNMTRFKLTTHDKDGDFVHCDVTRNNNGSGPGALPNVTINRDCSVEITALESDGYIDGGWGAVGVSVEDYYPRAASILGSGRNISTSSQTPFISISVQFMIETVRVLQDPVFVDPTFEDGHEFIVYVGSLVEIPLYAKPHPASKSDIDAFYVRSLPYRSYSVPTPLADPSRTSERVKYRTFSWRPQHTDVGYYILGVSVLDKNGQTGLERHYVMIVKDLPSNILSNQDRPYFVYSPIGSTVSCLQDTTCSFSLYYTSNNPSRKVANVSIDYSSLPNTETGLSSVTTTVVEGRTVYQTDVAITSPRAGHQIVCFTAHDDLGDTSTTDCVGVNIVPPDPCGSEPCGSNVCQSDGGSYVCICADGFTGTHCETDLKQCASSPCVQGTCRINPLTSGQYLCQCDHGWTGRNCETSSGTQPTVVTTAGTTTTPTTASVCNDSSNVNCQTLDAVAGICSLSNNLTHAFCSRYCRVCHDMTSTCKDNPYVDCPHLDRTTSMCSAKSPTATLYCPRYCKYCTDPRSTTTVKPTICNTCVGYECRFFARVVSCPQTKSYCRTVVTNMPTGATSYTKSCAGPAECSPDVSGLTPHQADCDNFDPKKKYFQSFTCSYCCTTDNCNGGRQTVPHHNTRVNITQPPIIG